MNARRLALFATLITVMLVVALWLRRERPAPLPATAALSPPVPKAPRPAPRISPARPDAAAKLAALAAEISPDSVSPIANELGAPNGTIRRDLEIVNELLVAWQTNFPRLGNPVGENDEITLALAGANSLKFAFIAPKHPAINGQGQLCDRWGTPFRFHQVSGTKMEIRSAGPDRTFATDDDVQFAP